jgi:hypothetical protein
MARFHVIGHFDLTIMVDDSGTTTVFEHCLCAMFAFQLGFLHISKDVSNDFNNFLASSLYQILMTSSHGKQWVVGWGHYHIVGDSLAHNYQETVLTVGP